MHFKVFIIEKHFPKSFSELTFSLCCSDFYQTVAREYGYCYIFNYFGTKTISRAGPDNGINCVKKDGTSLKTFRSAGLKVVLRSDPREYLPITETTGFLIRINQEVTSPYPRTYGHQLNVGFMTNVAMTFVRG